MQNYFSTLQVPVCGGKRSQINNLETKITEGSLVNSCIKITLVQNILHKWFERFSTFHTDT